MVYPAMIFGYALMLERDPGKYFWYFIVVYTQILVLLQFIMQLTIWNDYANTFATNFYQATLNGNLGLKRLPDVTFGEIFNFFLPELLIEIFTLWYI